MTDRLRETRCVRLPKRKAAMGRSVFRFLSEASAVVCERDHYSLLCGKVSERKEGLWQSTQLAVVLFEGGPVQCGNRKVGGKDRLESQTGLAVGSIVFHSCFSVIFNLNIIAYRHFGHFLRHMGSILGPLQDEVL